MALKNACSVFLCFAFTIAVASCQSCSLNVVANRDLKAHPAFDDQIPVIASLHEAVELVAKQTATASHAISAHDFTVCIFGHHVLTKPLLVHSCSTSSSHARVIWLGFDARISGGIQLQSWQQVAGATYSVKVPSSFTGPTIRDLWPAGKAGLPPRRAARSSLQSPAQVLGQMTPWQNSDGEVGFATEHDIPATWQDNTQAIEFVWPIVVANWIEPRCCIRSIQVRNITLADPCGALLMKRNVYAKTLPSPARVEAVPTKTPSAGSFYHDSASGVLFYTLQSDETAADLEARSFTTAMESLLVITNSSQHSWLNISFQWSTWFQPNSPVGYVDTQSCVYASDSAGSAAEPPAAVTISLSSDIEITGCTFSAIGSPYALLAGDSSSRVNITDSYFYDLSGGAVRELLAFPSPLLAHVLTNAHRFAGLGNVLGRHDDVTDGSLVLSNNLMIDGGKQYAACAAVFAGYVFDTQITANSIVDFSCVHPRFCSPTLLLSSHVVGDLFVLQTAVFRLAGVGAGRSSSATATTTCHSIA